MYVKLPEAVTVAKFGYSSRDDRSPVEAPIVFDFVGSNNCHDWEVLGKYRTQFRHLGEEKRWMVRVKSRKSFTCFGIRVSKGPEGSVAALKNFKLWKQLGMFSFVLQVRVQNHKLYRGCHNVGYRNTSCYYLAHKYMDTLGIMLL